MRSRTGSRILRASSGSRSASSSIEPLRSANSTVTCLRSPSSADFDARIFSARLLQGIGVLSRKLGLCDVRAKFGPAFAAELLVNSIGRTAGRAHLGQTRTTLAAELE